MSEPRLYIPIPAGFQMVLRQGDDVFARLEALMARRPSRSRSSAASVSPTLRPSDSSIKVGRGSLGLSITAIPIRLERSVDPGIGANVLQL
jgi:hypothetical protein